MARHQILSTELTSKRNEMGFSNETISNVVQSPPSSGTVVTSSQRPEARSKTPLWKALAPVAIPVVLALLPVPSGLAPYAWYFFSIFVGVIVGLILEPLPGAAIAVIGITLVTVFAPFALFSPQQLAEPGFRPASAALAWALSGYSNSTVWLIFGAFILALAY